MLKQTRTVQIILFFTLFSIFLVPIIPFYVGYEMVFPNTTSQAFLFRIIVSFAFFCWLLLAILQPAYRPQKSGILIGLGAFLGCLLISSVFSQHAHIAFWGNYERMSGFIFMAHVLAYFLVASSVLQSKRAWTWLVRVSVGTAVAVAAVGILRLEGIEAGRLESTLGNAGYLSGYMLFHLGLAGFLAAQPGNRIFRVLWALCAALFFAATLLAGTRGTVIGVGIGLLTGMGFLALRGAAQPWLRISAVAGLATATLGGSLLFAARDSGLVQETAALARIVNTDLRTDEGLQLRRVVWGMAVESAKERPIFGWGPENTTYSFFKHYDPQIYKRESWFDRYHNSLLDWLVWTGIFGLMIYLYVMFATLKAILKKPEGESPQPFSTTEQAVLLGFGGAFLIHSMVTFDVLATYIPSMILLGLVHQRTAEPWIRLMAWEANPRRLRWIYAPVIVLGLVGSIYFLNVPHKLAARDLYFAITHQHDRSQQYAFFDQALARGSWANQEITTHLVEASLDVQADPSVAEPIKSRFKQRSEVELAKVIARNPRDVRLRRVAGEFFRMNGALEEAAEHLAIARVLAPLHQEVILEQAVVARSRGRITEYEEFLRDAFEADPNQHEPRQFYLAQLLTSGDRDRALFLLNGADSEFLSRVAHSDMVLTLLLESSSFGTLAKVFEHRVSRTPHADDEWISLSVSYLRAGDLAAAVHALERGIAASPSLAPMGNCIITNLRAGRAPDAGC